MDKPMIQMLVGVGVVGIGIYLITEDLLIVGILLIVIGGAFFNGASHGVWFSFESDNDHFGDGDSGGGDD